MKLWKLEGTTNEYHCGPELICLWQKKPSLNALATALFNKTLEDLQDNNIIKIVAISRGEEVRLLGALSKAATRYDDFQLTETCTLD